MNTVDPNHRTVLKKTSAQNGYGIVSDLLWLGLIYAAGQAVVLLFLILGRLITGREAGKALLIVSFIAGGMVITLGVYGMLRYRKISFSVLALHRPQLKDFGYALLGFVSYLFLSIVAASLLRQIPGLDFTQKQDTGLDSISGILLPLAFVALAVIPPISEELLFRGFLYNRLKYHKLRPLFAALLTSVLFGLVHSPLTVTLDTFILSLVMIYMFEIRKSLWVTIFMHAIKNTVAFFALFIFKVV